MSSPKTLFAMALATAFAITGSTAVFAKTRPHAATDAKVTMKAARATALARVPGGKVQAVELEREHGKLVYSFDIRVPGKSGVEEVQVDAMKGDVVSQVHETAKAERKEARAEKTEAKGRR